MADAQTRITDVIDPEILAKMVLLRLPNNTILIPGVFTTSDFPMGERGTIWTIPYNNNLGDLETFIAGTDLKEQKLTQDDYRMPVVSKAAVYVADKIVKNAAYKDPMGFVTEQLVTQTIPEMYMATQILIMDGAIPADNRVVAGTSMSAAKIRVAKQRLGDKQARLKHILMHSVQYAALDTAKEIVWQPRSSVFPVYETQVANFGAQVINDLVATVAGLIIHVSDNCTLGGGSPETYMAYLLTDNAMGHFWQQNLNIDLDRVVKAKEDIISPDLDFVMCLHGVDYTSTSYTDANLTSTANYDLKWDQKLVGAVRLETLV